MTTKKLLIGFLVLFLYSLISLSWLMWWRLLHNTEPPFTDRVDAFVALHSVVMVFTFIGTVASSMQAISENRR